MNTKTCPEGGCKNSQVHIYVGGIQVAFINVQ